MAEIYKVKTVGLAGFEKVQALKRILPSAAQHGRFIRSFIDEARIAVELSHRNIVQVFDFGKAEGDLYLAMELIEGQDLRAAMTASASRHLPCPLGVAAYIISEVAAGLDYAHRKVDAAGRSLGIVHCDMSPSNVMLSVDGYVKILDFGIARASFASALERRRLRGKPRYMAPEQTRGDQPTAATDVFALGIIAWELVAGRPLFGGGSLREILHDVRTGPVPALRELVPEVPSEMADAIATALERDPARRGSAADLGAGCVRTALSSGPRAVASWQDELAQRGSSPGGVRVSAVGGVPMRRAGAPAGRLSAVSIALRDEPSEAPATPDSLPEVVVSDASGPTRADERRAPRTDPPPLAEQAGTDDPEYDSIDAALDRPTVVDPRGRAEAQADDNDDAIDDRPNELGMDEVAALGNRRRVVVTVGLLDGATADTLRILLRSLGDLAYQRGGVVLARDERSLTVAFGLEVVGEDDAAAAMSWAMDASAVVREAATEGGSLTLRLGGHAAASATISADAPPIVDPAAVAEARALAKQAQVDRPLFLGGTGRLGSALFALREVALKRPHARGGRAVEVLARRSHDERRAALAERRGRFAGRQRELSALVAAEHRAIAEKRRVMVLVRGASGVGKSRLCSEAAAQALVRWPRAELVVVTASPATRLAPFGLLVDFLQAALHLSPERGRAAREQLSGVLTRVLRRAAVEPDVARAVIGDLERAMELRDGVRVDGTELTDLRDRISAGLTVVRRSLLATRRPLPGQPPGAPQEGLASLIVVENLHHADNPSLEALRYTLSNREEGAELFLCTTQATEPPWSAFEEVCDLSDLRGAELKALAIDRLGEAASPLNVAAVISRAGGTPLFVEELAAAVREAGDELPASARDVIATRIDRLSPAAKTAVRLGAVLGETVRPRLLEELLGGGDLGAVLEELCADGLWERRDEAAPESPEGELAFARGLFREVVYDGMSSRARRDAHAHIGRLLAARFFAGRDEPPALIAEHLEKGGEVAAAAAFWLRAGRLALAAGDAKIAVVHFSQCLELEGGLGAVPPSTPSRVRRREALLGREHARRLLGELGTGDHDLAALEVLCAEQPRRQADLANRMAQRQLRRGDHAAALAATQRAERLARTAGDERLRAEALRLRGEVFEVQGDFDEALAFVAQAGAIFRRYGYLADEISAMVGTGRIHLLRANYEAARDAYRPVIDSLARTADPWLERIVRNHLALIELCLGHFSEARVLAERAVELCQRHGDRAREGDALSVSALILSKVGLYEEAVTQFSSALDVLTRTASRWSRTDCLISAGTCDVRRGAGDGLAKLDEAVREAQALGARYLEAHALVARADAKLRLGEAQAAVNDAEAGAQLARRATLVSCEIQGLARQAVAQFLLGSPELASPLAQRALTLLDRQRYLEGSEEEVLSACGRVLCATGELERGQSALAGARAAIARKLETLRDPVWRETYAVIVEQRQLLREN